MATRRQDHRLLFLVHGYYPDDPRVRRQAECLQRAGYRVLVHCTAGQAPGASWDCNGVTVHEAEFVKTRASLPRYVQQYLRMTRDSARLIRKLTDNEPLSLIQVATLPDFLVWATRSARRQGTQVILDLHESMPDFFSSKYGGLARVGIESGLRLLEKNCVRHADLVLTVNDELADSFERRFRRRPEVFYNAVDEASFGEPRATALWPETKNLVYHGTLSYVYGLDLVIRALPEVLQAFPGTTFNVFGSGPSEPDLRALVQDLDLTAAVVFHGRVPLTEIPKHLRNMHVGLVPTIKDSFFDMSLATKLLEYVYIGLPVVASDLRAVKRVFPTDDALFFFSANDHHSLARTLIDALGRPAAEISRRISNALELYQPIAWKTASSRYLDLIDQLVIRPAHHAE
ncbi:MAG: glycosyltransferase family 4 protein [Acidobacteriota bacterium]|nr:glycosyltransferase family 4 protein [Acidobacteriota bacterium]